MKNTEQTTKEYISEMNMRYLYNNSGEEIKNLISSIIKDVRTERENEEKQRIIEEQQKNIAHHNIMLRKCTDNELKLIEFFINK